MLGLLPANDIGRMHRVCWVGFAEHHPNPAVGWSIVDPAHLTELFVNRHAERRSSGK